MKQVVESRMFCSTNIEKEEQKNSPYILRQSSTKRQCWHLRLDLPIRFAVP
jgi:hypothetical protein